MFTTKNKWCFAITTCLLFMAAGYSKAQSIRTNTNNFNTWIVYNGQHLITDKLGIHAEIQVRRK